MILEISLFLIASALMVLLLMRPLKFTLPQEIEIIENEINKWLETPLISLPVAEVPNADSLDWKTFRRGITGEEGLYGTYMAGMQTETEIERLKSSVA